MNRIRIVNKDRVVLRGIIWIVKANVHPLNDGMYNILPTYRLVNFNSSFLNINVISSERTS